MTQQTVTAAGPMLGSTTFSFTNPFHARRCTFEQIVRKIAELDIGPGLEVIGFQLRGFPHVSDDFAARFRDLVAELQLKPTSLAIAQADNYGRSLPYGNDHVRFVRIDN